MISAVYPNITSSCHVIFDPELAKYWCESKIRTIGFGALMGVSAYFCPAPFIPVATGLIGLGFSHFTENSSIHSETLGILTGLALNTLGFETSNFFPRWTFALITGTSFSLLSILNKYLDNYQFVRDEFEALDKYLINEIGKGELITGLKNIKIHLESISHDMGIDHCVIQDENNLLPRSNLWSFLITTAYINPLLLVLLMLKEDDVCNMLKGLQNASTIHPKQHFRYLIKLLALRIQACYEEDSCNGKALQTTLEGSSCLPDSGFSYLVHMIKDTAEFKSIIEESCKYRESFSELFDIFIKLITRRGLQTINGVARDSIDWEEFLIALFSDNIFYKDVNARYLAAPVYDEEDILVENAITKTSKLSIASECDHVKIKCGLMAFGEVEVRVSHRVLKGMIGSNLNVNIHKANIAKKMISIVGKEYFQNPSGNDAADLDDNKDSK